MQILKKNNIEQLKEALDNTKEILEDSKKILEAFRSDFYAFTTRIKDSNVKYADEQIIEYQEIGNNLRFYHLWRQRAFTLCLAFNSFFILLLKFKEPFDTPINMLFYTVSLKTLYCLIGLLGTLTCWMMDRKTYYYYNELKKLGREYEEKNGKLSLYNKLFFSGKEPIKVSYFLKGFYISFIIFWIIILMKI